tara:strand:- start:173 stop:469 length:297 start_codon:yes stop_codon:yes gene_type:complete
MALPLIDDLTSILSVDEFAVTVTYDGGTINGIFDNETIPVDNGGFVTVHQEQPQLTCRTSDLPSVGEGEVMVISGVTYVVRAWIHDGTGVTVVQLEKS